MKRAVVPAIALLVVTASWMFGSITLTGAGSTVIAPPAVRQGTYLSPDVVVPSNITTAMFAFDSIPASDYENPANSMTFIVECSADGVSGWTEAAGFTWHGSNGPVTDPKTGVIDPVNSVTFDVRRWATFHCRANVTIPNAITAGLTVTTQ